MIGCLRNLPRRVCGLVILGCDVPPCYRSRETDKHFEVQVGWLKVEAFAADAPELGPLVYVWVTLRSRDIANCSPDTIAEPDDQLLPSMRRVRHRQRGPGFIEEVGLIPRAEYLQLCKDQWLSR
ncbi:MAG TPA: hypothetical protein DGT21_14615 [Armatimonadetes bacterium]|nr:hypothetical protein [Armatimonadota bacterium]